PDIDRLLAWDEEKDGAIPADLSAIPVSEVREYVTRKSAETAAQTEARVRQELLDQQEREREQAKSRAEVEKDIAWAEDLEKRRRSDDAATREAANREYDTNEDRYVRALAARHRLRE